MLPTILQKISTRSLVVLILVSGSLALAIEDKQFRAVFADLVKVGLGGYLAQLVPKEEP